MDTLTAAQAIEHAIRLLEAAEAETNLALMDSLSRTAEVWIYLAMHLRESE